MEPFNVAELRFNYNSHDCALRAEKQAGTNDAVDGSLEEELDEEALNNEEDSEEEEDDEGDEVGYGGYGGYEDASIDNKDNKVDEEVV